MDININITNTKPCLNDTTIHALKSALPVLSDERTNSTSGGDHDALYYITVVLAIYAVSIILLMIKYIRRERREAVYDNYYLEFVKRDQFRPGAISKIVMEKFPRSGRSYGTEQNFVPV